MLLPAAYAPPRATAAPINGRVRMNIIASSLAEPPDPVLHAVRQGQAEGNHELWCGRDCLRPADLRRDGTQDADEVFRRGPGIERIAHLPEISGRRRGERDERGDFDEAAATRIQA